MKPLMRCLHSILAAALVMLAMHCNSQQMPDFGVAFPQDEVTTIRITIDPDSFNVMMATLENEHEFPATFIFESTSLMDTVTNIGLRLRGNTSLNAAKKSFKISFNTFDAGGDWQDLEKINLLGTVNDPSLMRTKLAHDLFRKAGIVAARTSYTRLYINNEYRGLYINVEHIDEKMTARYFDNQGDGNLYKCTYPADLDYISSNPNDYKFAYWGERHYDLTTNDYLDDYSDLSSFIATLNNSPGSNLPCALSAKFHVSEYLKIAAIDILLGNWDGYIFNKNNFYLYHDQLTDRIQFIPYDLDNTFGIDWVGVDWSQRSIYSWSQQGQDRPLYTRLLQNTAYRNLFSKHIDDLCATHFHPDSLSAQIEYWQNLILPHVQEDPYYSLDFGFSQSTFLSSPFSGCCNHIPLGILPYVEARRSNALNQLESYSLQTIDANYITQRIDTGAVSLKARMGGPINSVQASYSWDGVSFTNESMSYDALSDAYHFVGPPFNPITDKLHYKAIVNGSSNFPCIPDFHWMTRSSFGVKINETCAVNQSLNADNFGEFNDWVELYNTTGNALTLSNCYLTDDYSNWNRWKLPDTLLPANGHMLFWLDDDLEQGRNHANFKLGPNETLWLYRIEEGKPRVVDSAMGFSPVANQTWALQPDGGSQAAYTPGTPGASNTISSVDEWSEKQNTVYPCPATTEFFWEQQATADLFDAQGNLVMEGISQGKVECGHLMPGMYVLVSGSQTFKLVIQPVAK
jgi:spore coat protein H